MRVAVSILLAVLALAASGCSGGETETAPSAAGTATGPREEADQLEPAPEAALVLREFVGAAAAGDVDAMWERLSATSKEALGPTRRAFAQEAAPGFQRGLGSFASGSYEVVVSTETASGWAVAAIAGVRRRAGDEEFAAYGVALRKEDGEWKLELGAPVELRQLEPPRATPDASPRVEVAIAADEAVDEAGLWVDGEPLPATAGGTPSSIRLTATAEPLEPGWHVLTVFGRSGDHAAAGAAPFFVEEPTGGTATMQVA